MKKIISFIVVSLMFVLASCGSNNSTTAPSNSIDDAPSTTIPFDDTTNTETKEGESYLSMTLVLTIGTTEVDVYWMNNDSFKALKKLAKDGLTLGLHQYGGFEQTGSLGTSIPSNDTLMNVGPGDIVLYNSNQICLYYSTNSYSFTKLGHINLGWSELVELLGEEDNVTIKLNLK